MVIIARRGKPAYLKADFIVSGDILELIKPPEIIDAGLSEYGKERTAITVLLTRTGTTYRWSLNTTTNDRCVDIFGEEGQNWVGKKVKIEKILQNVSGSMKDVLYGIPLQQSSQEMV